MTRVTAILATVATIGSPHDGRQRRRAVLARDCFRPAAGAIAAGAAPYGDYGAGYALGYGPALLRTGPIMNRVLTLLRLPLLSATGTCVVW